MTVTDQIKILEKFCKMKHRKPAKISALSSINLDKYEYLTGEDLGLKLLNKPNLSILHWVQFLIKGRVKMIKKKDCLRD